ncbi:MAG TPA: CpsD/CapB family tyrosine-protein kinase [Candidatus Limiplasma sp.]|nr:CpsD/CapB family tyrosine-protein kinase [Candidatus Limiplasma sp.]
MKAAFYLWKRRLVWVVLLSIVLAGTMGAYAYLYMPLRYEAVAEILMLPSGTAELSALADESIRWSQYDALKTGAPWDETMHSSVTRYGNTSLLLVKVTAENDLAAAKGANALAEALIGVINNSMNETVLKSVVTAGVPEAPIRFYRERYIAAVFLGAFILLSLLFLLISARRTKLIRSGDIARTAALPVLAEIPDLKDVMAAFERFDPEDCPPLYDFAGYHTHEQLRLITLAIRLRAKQDKLKSVAAVSGTDGEYRSAVLVMLAQELCRQGSRVLLVDMNWYAPRLARLLGVKGDRDLIHCLASNIPVEQAMVQTPTRNLYFLDQNHTQSMAAQLLASASFAAFLDKLYGKFDFVLFDMPEASLFTDALAISGILHGVLPVIRASRWTPAQIKQWLAPMDKLGRSALGLVITDASVKQARTHRRLDQSTGF